MNAASPNVADAETYLDLSPDDSQYGFDLLICIISIIMALCRSESSSDPSLIEKMH